MANTTIKITQLTPIGNNISFDDLVAVVNMTGTPVTQKANLQIVGNLILQGAGGSYFAPAAIANLAFSVVNAAQPNITSVGTLTGLTLSGNLNSNANINVNETVFTNNISVTTFANLGPVSNIYIEGGTDGDVLTTDGTGNLSWGAGLISATIFSSLPAASAGARGFITDGNLQASGNFGEQISGGGSNAVPVYSDGTNWFVG